MLRAVELRLPEIGIADHVSTAPAPRRTGGSPSTGWRRTARRCMPSRRGTLRSGCSSAARRSTWTAARPSWTRCSTNGRSSSSCWACTWWTGSTSTTRHFAVTRAGATPTHCSPPTPDRAEGGRLRPVRHPRPRGLHRPLGPPAGDRRPAEDRGGAGRAGRVGPGARAQHRPDQRPGRRHVPVARDPAHRLLSRHPADDRRRRARGGPRRPPGGTRPIALAREAGYRETLRVSDHTLVPLPG